jgi:hypothetical protein
MMAKKPVKVVRAKTKYVFIVTKPAWFIGLDFSGIIE